MFHLCACQWKVKIKVAKIWFNSYRTSQYVERVFCAEKVSFTSKKNSGVGTVAIVSVALCGDSELKQVEKESIAYIHHACMCTVHTD